MRTWGSSPGATGRPYKEDLLPPPANPAVRIVQEGGDRGSSDTSESRPAGAPGQAAGRAPGPTCHHPGCGRSGLVVGARGQHWRQARSLLRVCALSSQRPAAAVGFPSPLPGPGRGPLSLRVESGVRVLPQAGVSCRTAVQISEALSPGLMDILVRDKTRVTPLAKSPAVPATVALSPGHRAAPQAVRSWTARKGLVIESMTGAPKPRDRGVRSCGATDKPSGATSCPESTAGPRFISAHNSLVHRVTRQQM